jgi:hypothetical protein
MSQQLIMPWIDLLLGAAKTDFQERRDTIQVLTLQAAELTHNAQLREHASLAACKLEGDVRGKFSAEGVEKAKNLAYPSS